MLSMNRGDNWVRRHHSVVEVVGRNSTGSTQFTSARAEQAHGLISVMREHRFDMKDTTSRRKVGYSSCCAANLA